MPGLFYLQEETEVTVSVVLSDGRRLLLTDPNEISLESSNSSIVSVSGNKIIGVSEGVIELNVTWIGCSGPLMTHFVTVSVEFDQFRPFFSPDYGNTTVPEDTPVGSTIAILEATDEDVINIHNDDIQYNIKDDPYNGLFVVDEELGSVRLTRLLDRERLDVYVIEVEATDAVQRRQRECLQQPAAPTQGPTSPPPAGVSGSGLMDVSGSGDDAPPAPPTTAPADNTTCPPVSPVSVFTVSYEEKKVLIILSFLFLLPSTLFSLPSFFSLFLFIFFL